MPDYIVREMFPKQDDDAPIRRVTAQGNPAAIQECDKIRRGQVRNPMAYIISLRRDARLLREENLVLRHQLKIVLGAARTVLSTPEGEDIPEEAFEELGEAVEGLERAFLL